MRTIQLTLTTLYVVLMTSVAFAKDNEPAQPMDPQATMELYKKPATPGEPH
jgi:hypothetical protein